MNCSIACYLVQDSSEVQLSGLACPVRICNLNQISSTYDIFQAGKAHFGQIFAYFLSQEGKIIYQIFVMSPEVLPQLFVLCSDSYWTKVGMALAHHYTAQHDKGGCSECIFIGTQQRHADNVLTGFQLTVCLQAYLSAQTVQHQCLLGFTQSYFRRDTGIAHGRCR